MKNNKQGFTILEVIAVIVTIATVYILLNVTLCKAVDKKHTKESAAVFKGIDKPELQIVRLDENNFYVKEVNTKQDFENIQKVAGGYQGKNSSELTGIYYVRNAMERLNTFCPHVYNLIHYAGITNGYVVSFSWKE